MSPDRSIHLYRRNHHLLVTAMSSELKYGARHPRFYEDHAALIFVIMSHSGGQDEAD